MRQTSYECVKGIECLMVALDNEKVIQEMTLNFSPDQRERMVLLCWELQVWRGCGRQRRCVRCEQTDYGLNTKTMTISEGEAVSCTNSETSVKWSLRKAAASLLQPLTQVTCDTMGCMYMYIYLY